eukprot:scaffold10558_cov111-Isochrysis_galbana.AAC.6
MYLTGHASYIPGCGPAEPHTGSDALQAISSINYQHLPPSSLSRVWPVVTAHLLVGVGVRVCAASGRRMHAAVRYACWRCGMLHAAHPYIMGGRCCGRMWEDVGLMAGCWRGLVWAVGHPYVMCVVSIDDMNGAIVCGTTVCIRAS